MKFVAFFRNLNLGRPPAPTRAQLESAFLDAGAASAESFLTNGTLVFETNTPAKAKKIVKRACTILQELNGFREPAFVRDLDYLAALVRRDPFAAVEHDDAYALGVTFLQEGLELPSEPPRENRKKDVIAVEYTPAEFLSLVYKFNSSPGNPNDFIEKAFGRPATTRVWNTVCRLVKKHA
jgi:uncharacterized protein (DUF1697 family)